MVKKKSAPMLSHEFRAFHDLVSGWAYTNKAGVRRRLELARPFLKQITDPDEKRVTIETIESMEGILAGVPL